MTIHHFMKFDKNIQIRYMYFLCDGAILTHDLILTIKDSNRSSEMITTSMFQVKSVLNY